MCSVDFSHGIIIEYHSKLKITYNNKKKNNYENEFFEDFQRCTLRTLCA